MIVEKQDALGWGKPVVEIPASDLQKEFPGIRGIRSVNSERMRNFFLICFSDKNLQTLSADFSWFYNVTIPKNCIDQLKKIILHENVVKIRGV